MRTDSTVWWFVAWTAVAFPVNALQILGHWYAISPRGDDAVLWLVGLLAFPFLVALLCLPVALITLAVRRLRPKAWRLLGASLVYLIAFIICGRAAGHVRMEAMAALARRSRPVVEALRAYEREHGRPPKELGDLVPRHLSAVPQTGLAAYPDYELLTGDAATVYEGNAWVLLVSTPSGGINFDVLAYFPRQNYPEVGHGGWWEHIDDWAYLHE